MSNSRIDRFIIRLLSYIHTSIDKYGNYIWDTNNIINILVALQTCLIRV